MKYENTNIAADVGILYNSHYVALPYDCTSLTSLATNGVIPAGTVIPANGATAFGVLLHDVTLADNPNGTVVVDGFINVDKLPAAPSAAAIAALPKITFMNGNGRMVKKVSVTYSLNGATGTAVTDSSSPYAYGSTVTVKSAPTISTYPTGMTAFDEWNTEPDGSGTSYDPSDTFTITDDTTLYAIYKA